MPCILWNLKFHCRVHKSPPLLPVLSQINPVYVFPDDILKIQFNIIIFHLCLGLPSVLLHSGFPTKTIYTAILFVVIATRPSNLILLYT